MCTLFAWFRGDAVERNGALPAFLALEPALVCLHPLDGMTLCSTQVRLSECPVVALKIKVENWLNMAKFNEGTAGIIFRYHVLIFHCNK